MHRTPAASVIVAATAPEACLKHGEHPVGGEGELRLRRRDIRPREPSPS